METWIVERRLPRRRGIWILLQGIFGVLWFVTTMMHGTGLPLNGTGGGWDFLGNVHEQDEAAVKAVRDGTIGPLRLTLFRFRRIYVGRNIGGQRWMVAQWKAAGIRDSGEGTTLASLVTARSTLAYRLMVLLRRIIDGHKRVLPGTTLGWLVRVADLVHALEVLFAEAVGRWIRVVFDRLSEERLAVEIDLAVSMLSSISKVVSGLDNGATILGMSGLRYMQGLDRCNVSLDDPLARAVRSNGGELLCYLIDQLAGNEDSVRFWFRDWNGSGWGGAPPLEEEDMEFCWSHMNLGGSRLQGPARQLPGYGRPPPFSVDVTVHLCEVLDSFSLHTALAECRKYSNMGRYLLIGEVPYNWSSIGIAKQEFALHERTTSRCIFEEWRARKSAA